MTLFAYCVNHRLLLGENPTSSSNKKGFDTNESWLQLPSEVTSTDSGDKLSFTFSDQQLQGE